MLSNIETCCLKLIQLLGIPITQEQLSRELEIHPEFPSLLSASDVFSNFKVENVAYKVRPDQLDQIQTPFLAYTSSGFMVIEQVTRDTVITTNEQWDKKEISLEAFRQLFKGVVLEIESFVKHNKQQSSQISNQITANLKPITYAFFALSLAMLGYVNQTLISEINLWIVFLFIVKMVGLGTSVLLLVQAMNENNSLVQKICGTKSDCNSILNSSAAKAFWGLSWSELGFFYFAGTSIILIFQYQSSTMLQMLAFTNLLCLPYSIYSIYYQARVAKQWCKLCSIVQGVFWLEFVLLFPSLKSGFTAIQISNFIGYSCFMLLPIVIWFALKPLLAANKKAAGLSAQLKKIKFRSYVFNSLLSEQKQYQQPDENASIVLGNLNSTTVITFATNPYCSPCAEAHQVLHEWMEAGRDFQLRLVFTAKNNDADIQTPISRHLMALYHLEDKNIVKTALHHWYKKTESFEEWAKHYPVEVTVETSQKLAAHRQWCNQEEITATPTLMINGYKIPSEYQLADIKYLIG